jgi:2-polyprenyl-6-methoxyphenol hydroxylase-like FAD-dependent oxidoreductase
MNSRYQNKNIAVLGAGLSGTAAALLLRSHDANVSVLDSATENKLPESTIKNLRDHGVRVISGSGRGNESRFLRSCCPQSRN